MIATEQIRKVQMLQLKIACEMKRICEKHSIPYFMIDGTLLGAVRHGGFIPWDDDMDFGMLRADYDRFIEACKTELHEDYFLQTWDTDPEYPFSYTKIRLNGTHFVEAFSDGCGMHDGIFIDIFPFDSVPDGVWARKKQALRYFICKRLLWIKKGMGRNMKQDSAKQRIKYILFSLFSKFFSYEAVKRYFANVQKRYNDCATKLVVTDYTYSYSKESIPREWVKNLKPLLFENVEFSAASESEAYLSHLYGDYMQLPPVEKRTGHQIKYVDFGRWK